MEEVVAKLSPPTSKSIYARRLTRLTAEKCGLMF